MTGTVDITTMIAELEEALKAATPEPWIVSSQNKKDVEGGPPSDHNGFRHLVSDSYTGRDDIDEANARLIALMRNHLPALIEVAEAAQDMWRLTLLIETGVRQMEGVDSVNCKKTLAAIKRLRTALEGVKK